jgi:hypothetical protein
MNFSKSLERSGAGANVGVGDGAPSAVGPVADLQRGVEVQTGGAVELLGSVVVALAELGAVTGVGQVHGQVAGVRGAGRVDARGAELDGCRGVRCAGGLRLGVFYRGRSRGSSSCCRRTFCRLHGRDARVDCRQV